MIKLLDPKKPIEEQLSPGDIVGWATMGLTIEDSSSGGDLEFVAGSFQEADDAIFLIGSAMKAVSTQSTIVGGVQVFVTQEYADSREAEDCFIDVEDQAQIDEIREDLASASSRHEQLSLFVDGAE